MKKRKEKRKYVARPGIEPRTPDLRVRCPTDSATRAGLEGKAKGRGKGKGKRSKEEMEARPCMRVDWLVAFGLTALSDSSNSIYIKPSPEEREKEM